MMRKAGFLFLFLILTSVGFLVADDPKSAADLDYGRGVEAFYRGDYQIAKSSLENANKADPDNPAPLYFLGLCSLRNGETEQAKSLFFSAAEKEYTPSGRLVYIPGHLRRIQGNERMMIEEIRKEVGAINQEKERRRQFALYGRVIDKNRRFLCGGTESTPSPLPPKSTEPLIPSSSDSNVPASSEGRDLTSLPSVPPIRPLAEPEVDGYVSYELADSGVGDIIILKEEYVTDEFGNVLKDDEGNPVLRTSLSTKGQRRKDAKEARARAIERARSEFEDIYSMDSSDNTAFGGEQVDGTSGSGGSKKKKSVGNVLNAIFGEEGAQESETDAETDTEDDSEAGETEFFEE